MSNANTYISQYRRLNDLAKEDLDAGTITEAQYDYIIKYDNIFINGLVAILGVSCCFSLIRLLIECFLLFGIVGYQHKFMLPWLIYYSILLVVGCLCTLALAIWFMVDLSVGLGFRIIFIYAPCLGLQFYFGIVVYSKYQNIRDGISGGGNKGGINGNETIY